MFSKKTAQVFSSSLMAGALALSLAACGNGLTGGVAAEVNGSKINEDLVTNYIQTLRESNELQTDEAWGQWLQQTHQTPEGVRERVLDIFIDEELIRQAAKENDVNIDTNHVNELIDSMKSNYKDDAEWKKALKEAGTTEDEYRKSIEISLLQKALMDKVAPVDENASDLDRALAFAKDHDNAHRSQHILFDKEDKALAEEVLGKIKSGELSFEDAVAQYSKDPGSKASNGDVGWDSLTTFVEPYATAVSNLKVDQVSDLVESEFGYHIIKCTDIFTAPETLESISDLPAEYQAKIRSDAGSQQQDKLRTWLKEYRDKAEITINPMPEKVPYNLPEEAYSVEATNSPASSDESEK